MSGQFSDFQDHVMAPRGRGLLPPGGSPGSAGGSACGDLLTISLSADDGRIAAIGFEASGCAALTACASATVELASGATLLDAGRIGRDAITAQLGGLSPERSHAAALAEEALHRALGALLAGEGPELQAADGDRVVIGLSGGVDSAVAADLLTLRGAEVVGVTLQLWDDPATDGTASCCSPQAVTAARRLAHERGMSHFTLDLRDGFRSGVVEPYLDAFSDGLTPNPCVGCNGHVRFDALDAARRRLGARALATGHYARIARDVDGPLLATAADAGKDQTYMLAALDPALLEHLEFPLGELTKPEVRDHARRAAIAVAEKPESQDLCFLAGIGRDDFLERHAGHGDRLGEIRDRAGRVLGRHRGAFRFTVGQRRGLGIAAPEPLYVLDVDAAGNVVTVGTRDELATYSVRVVGVRLLRDGATVDGVKLRYRNAPVACRVGSARAGHHRTLEIELLEPVDGAAPGQVACLMRGDCVVGWATIARAAKIPADELERDPRDVPVVL